MVRHLAHPRTGQPLCGAQGTWEPWETPVDEFEPDAWHGGPNCGRALGWLVEEGEQTPSCLAAMRHLLLHRGQVTTEVLPLLLEHAPVSVWHDRLLAQEPREAAPSSAPLSPRT